MIYLTAAEEVTEQLDEKIEEANKLVSTLEGYIPKLIDFAINVLIAIAILFIGKLIIKFIVKAINKALNKTHTDVAISKFLTSLIKAALYVVLIIILCDVVGIGTASFIALLGSGGVAIGLAMQGALSNLAGGVTILFVKPFRVGDYICEEVNNGVEGVVTKIDLFYTSLTTVDNKVILIPNGTLTSSRIVNVTTNAKRRVDVEVGVSYDANLESVKKIMWEVINKCEYALSEETHDVLVKELGDSQVTMEARVWVSTDTYWDAKFWLNETIKDNFDKSGIEIPYNQLSVHVVNK